jgi:hypothetical protein
MAGLAGFDELKGDRRAPGRVQGARDAAIFGLLFSGLRRAEIVALNREDYNAAVGETGASRESSRITILVARVGVLLTGARQWKFLTSFVLRIWPRSTLI